PSESNGLHDDVVVLGRALSDAEVEAFFTRGREWEPGEDTLLYLPFDGRLELPYAPQGSWYSPWYEWDGVVSDALTLILDKTSPPGTDVKVEFRGKDASGSPTSWAPADQFGKARI